MRIVIDTNVYMSFLMTPRGVGAWLMALWSEYKFEVVISPDLFVELVEVLARPDLHNHIDVQRKLALFRRLRYDAVWASGNVDVSEQLPDPKDNILMSAALELDAEFIITWDDLLTALGTHQGVRIITPDYFIPLLLRKR